MIIEFLEKLLLKIRIFIHKILNLSVYKNGVILHGIPRMINRDRISIGKSVRINRNVFLHGAGGIILKENVTLSYGVTVLSTGYDTSTWSQNMLSKEHLDKKIVIGKNVWVGANVTILPGVTIADNCIIGAGAVVNKPLKEEGCLYAGIPAKRLKKL